MSNYKLELVIDTSKHETTDGDDAWEFPATFETPGLQISEGHGHFVEPHGSSKPYSEIEKDVIELIEEWRNLVMNNDLVGQKIKITLNVERVF
jgi:hypothetical protein